MNLVSPEQINLLTKSTPGGIIWDWIAQYSEPFFVGILGALWVIFLYRRTRAYWDVPAYITGALAISVPLSMLIRELTGRTRPFVDGSFVPSVPHDPNFGFPSNHAVATMVFTVVFLWFGYRTIGSLLAMLTVLVGFSRVVTGLHYPGDILAGWLLGGITSAIICYYQAIPYSRFVPKFLRDHSPTENDSKISEGNTKKS